MVGFSDRSAATDLELLQGSLGDPEAFGVFYRRHADAVLRYCHLRTGCPETAADLTAEVFAAAFARRSSFRDEGRPARNWLYGIAGRQIGLYARRQRVSLKYRRKLGMERTALDADAIERLEAVSTPGCCGGCWGRPWWRCPSGSGRRCGCGWWTSCPTARWPGGWGAARGRPGCGCAGPWVC